MNEEGFARNDIVNHHNTHMWTDANPRAIMQVKNQGRFSINVWAGIFGNRIIGPYTLPKRLTGVVYHTFPREELPALLEYVTLKQRQRIFYARRGTTPFSTSGATISNSNVSGAMDWSWMFRIMASTLT